MKKLKLFETWVHGSTVELKPGDVLTHKGADMLVFSTPQINHGRNRPLSFRVIYKKDFDQFKKTKDKKDFKAYEIRTSSSDFKKTGRVSDADLKLAIQAFSEMEAENNKKYSEKQSDNFDRIGVERGIRYVQLADEGKAFGNDSVFVQFSNGRFPARVKAPFTTNSIGEVMVVFPNKTKATGIAPKRLFKNKS